MALPPSGQFFQQYYDHTIQSDTVTNFERLAADHEWLDRHLLGRCSDQDNQPSSPPPALLTPWKWRSQEGLSHDQVARLLGEREEKQDIIRQSNLPTNATLTQILAQAEAFLCSGPWILLKIAGMVVWLEWLDADSGFSRQHSHSSPVGQAIRLSKKQGGCKEKSQKEWPVTARNLRCGLEGDSDKSISDNRKGVEPTLHASNSSMEISDFTLSEFLALVEAGSEHGKPSCFSGTKKDVEGQNQQQQLLPRSSPVLPEDLLKPIPKIGVPKLDVAANPQITTLRRSSRIAEKRKRSNEPPTAETPARKMKCAAPSKSTRPKGKAKASKAVGRQISAGRSVRGRASV